ncbi:MAG: hypothetical protein M3168_02895 [Actinomycetota bacterium]|nr:hypothetical protein [Actinomycetota bacterium]
MDDVDAALERVEQNGGKALHAHPDLPTDFGDFGLATDPDGLVFGVWRKPS